MTRALQRIKSEPPAVIEAEAILLDEKVAISASDVWDRLVTAQHYLTSMKESIEGGWQAPKKWKQIDVELAREAITKMREALDVLLGHMPSEAKPKLPDLPEWPGCPHNAHDLFCDPNSMVPISRCRRCGMWHRLDNPNVWYGKDWRLMDTPIP